MWRNSPQPNLCLSEPMQAEATSFAKRVLSSLSRCNSHTFQAKHFVVELRRIPDIFQTLTCLKDQETFWDNLRKMDQPGNTNRSKGSIRFERFGEKKLCAFRPRRHKFGRGPRERLPRAPRRRPPVPGRAKGRPRIPRLQTCFLGEFLSLSLCRCVQRVLTQGNEEGAH